MRIKTNTPLSDAELSITREIFEDEENPDAALYNAFPGVPHRIDGGTIYMGAPPWDMEQEI